jgi:cytochrome oxidase assembly protein ShyY1
MRRLPLVPTVLVALAIAAMIGLGVWQLQRAGEKERLLAEFQANAAMPALDLDPVLDRDPAELPPLAFRRVLVTCRAINMAPELRGGRSRAGEGGYAYLLPCRPGTSGLSGRLLVNVGWSRLPDDGRRLTLNGLIAGTLGAARPEAPVVLTSATAPALLAPSAPPDIADISNNHLFYAFQWFFFAAAAAVIYALALRQRLSRPGRGPKSGAR